MRVDSEAADIFPRVDVVPRHRRDLDGQAGARCSSRCSELNPTLAPFTQVVLRARTGSPSPGAVEIDGVGLTVATHMVAKSRAALSGPATLASMAVDCAAEPTPISPLIYGIAFSPMREHAGDHQWKLNPTARRWGGNPTSRFNWELGAAWNTGSDYFFENVDDVLQLPRLHLGHLP